MVEMGKETQMSDCYCSFMVQVRTTLKRLIAICYHPCCILQICPLQFNCCSDHCSMAYMSCTLLMSKKLGELAILDPKAHRCLTLSPRYSCNTTKELGKARYLRTTQFSLIFLIFPMDISGNLLHWTNYYNVIHWWAEFIKTYLKKWDVRSFGRP